MEDNEIFGRNNIFIFILLFQTQHDLTKLWNSADKYNLEPVISFYSSFTIAHNFGLNNTLEDKALKVINKIEISKAAVIGRLCGCFFIKWTWAFIKACFWTL